MGKTFSLSALAVVLAGTAFFLSGCGSTTTAPTQQQAAAPVVVTYVTGDLVAAKWSDGNWYHATVSAAENGKYEVIFDDGTFESDLDASKLKYVPALSDLKVGEKVLAVATESGRFYTGTVLELTSDGAKITWDDGTTPTVVVLEKIMRP